MYRLQTDTSFSDTSSDDVTMELSSDEEHLVVDVSPILARDQSRVRFGQDGHLDRQHPFRHMGQDQDRSRRSSINARDRRMKHCDLANTRPTRINSAVAKPTSAQVKQKEALASSSNVHIGENENSRHTTSTPDSTTVSNDTAIRGALSETIANVVRETMSPIRSRLYGSSETPSISPVQSALSSHARSQNNSTSSPKKSANKLADATLDAGSTGSRYDQAKNDDALSTNDLSSTTSLSSSTSTSSKTCSTVFENRLATEDNTRSSTSTNSSSTVFEHVFEDGITEEDNTIVETSDDSSESLLSSMDGSYAALVDDYLKLSSDSADSDGDIKPEQQDGDENERSSDSKEWCENSNDTNGEEKDAFNLKDKQIQGNDSLRIEHYSQAIGSDMLLSESLEIKEHISALCDRLAELKELNSKEVDRIDAEIESLVLKTEQLAIQSCDTAGKIGELREALHSNESVLRQYGMTYSSSKATTTRTRRKVEDIHVVSGRHRKPAGARETQTGTNLDVEEDSDEYDSRQEYVKDTRRVSISTSEKCKEYFSHTRIPRPIFQPTVRIPKHTSRKQQHETNEYNTKYGRVPRYRRGNIKSKINTFNKSVHSRGRGKDRSHSNHYMDNSRSELGQDNEMSIKFKYNRSRYANSSIHNHVDDEENIDRDRKDNSKNTENYNENNPRRRLRKPNELVHQQARVYSPSYQIYDSNNLNEAFYRYRPSNYNQHSPRRSVDNSQRLYTNYNGTDEQLDALEHNYSRRHRQDIQPNINQSQIPLHQPQRPLHQSPRPLLPMRHRPSSNYANRAEDCFMPRSPIANMYSRNGFTDLCQPSLSPICPPSATSSHAKRRMRSVKPFTTSSPLPLIASNANILAPDHRVDVNQQVYHAPNVRDSPMPVSPANSPMSMSSWKSMRVPKSEAV